MGHREGTSFMLALIGGEILRWVKSSIWKQFSSSFPDSFVSIFFPRRHDHIIMLNGGRQADRCALVFFGSGPCRQSSAGRIKVLNTWVFCCSIAPQYGQHNSVTLVKFWFWQCLPALSNCLDLWSPWASQILDFGGGYSKCWRCGSAKNQSVTW